MKEFVTLNEKLNESESNNGFIRYLINYFNSQQRIAKRFTSELFYKLAFSEYLTNETINVKYIDEYLFQNNNTKLKNEDNINITPTVIQNFCKQFNISHTCLDMNGNILIKFVSDRGKHALYYVYDNNNVYPIKKEYIRFIRERTKPKIEKHKPNYRESETQNIKKKIRTCLLSDMTLFNRKGNLKYEDVVNMLKTQSFKCWFCKEPVLTENWTAYCCYQFSIDRMDNAKPHDKDNCKIACYYCNSCHRQSFDGKNKVCPKGCHTEEKFIRGRTDVFVRGENNQITINYSAININDDLCLMGMGWLGSPEMVRENVIDGINKE